VAWNDESWKDGYDAWKLASPDDERDRYDPQEPQDECEHEEYEIDIVTGRAECQYCSHAWWASRAEIDAEQDRQAAYWEWTQRQEHWWYSRIDRVKDWWRSLWRRHSITQATIDDEIPF
jgi:hypothetical protein